VNPILDEYDLRLEENACERRISDKISFLKKLRSPRNLQSRPSICIVDKSVIEERKRKGTALAVLGGSQAPVDPNASADLLDGELLVLQKQSPPWDGMDLGGFLLSEREYGECFF
jgi:hypothetical protein